MQRHISPIAKQRISDFFTQEDGNVGRKNALMAGTILSSAMLAAALFAPETADAGREDCSEWERWCGSEEGVCCSIGQSCCSDWYWDCCPWKKVHFYFCVDGTFCEPPEGG